MAFRSDLSKLPLPTDIGEEEKFLTHRQKLIEDKLLKCYAEEISSEISSLVLENCEGCRINHGSQRQHDCLMMEADQKIWLYFDSALERVCEARIVEAFAVSLQSMKPVVSGLELLKYTYRDWRMMFCTNQRQLLKRETLKRV